MDPNSQKCVFLASFPLNSTRVLAALLMNKLFPMVIYPFLRMVGWFDPQASLDHIPFEPQNDIRQYFKQGAGRDT